MFLLAALSLGGCSAGSQAPRAGFPAHHTETGFRNHATVAPPSKLALALDRLRLALFTRTPGAPRGLALGRRQAAEAWSRLGRADGVLWVGHATVLIRLSGKTILTDPVFARYLTPVPPFGPRRLVPPGLPVDKLPRIDFILVSHNHYDHFEPKTLRRIAARDRPRCFVPLGVGDPGQTLGCRRLVRFDWGQARRVGRLTFRFLRAQHDSGRGLFDRNRTLWGSWLVVSPRRRVYFAGDTGYGPHFRAIARRHGPIDLAILPIGAFLPRWVNRTVHLSPAEALRAFLDLRARRMLAVHWGTYALGVDGPYTPPKILLKSARGRVARDRLWIFRIGESRRL